MNSEGRETFSLGMTTGGGFQRKSMIRLNHGFGLSYSQENHSPCLDENFYKENLPNKKRKYSRILDDKKHTNQITNRSCLDKA